jgi:general secretion pathway protein C
MFELSGERARLAQTAIVPLATLIALLLLGTVLAYWTWTWIAPAALPRVQIAEAPSRIVPAYGLFGGADTPTPALAPTGLAIKLLGVAAAAKGRRGYAVLQLEAREILSVREGDEVAPGVRLAEVHADRVVLERNGAREILAWPDKNNLKRERLAQPSAGYQNQETAAPQPGGTQPAPIARRAP